MPVVCGTFFASGTILISLRSAVCDDEQGSFGRYSDVRLQGVTPLHVAVREGRLEVARFLLLRRAKKDAQDEVRARCSAYRCNVPRVKQGMLVLRCDKCYACWRAQNGLTPLYGAAMNGQLECVRLLLGRGADVNAKDRVRIPVPALVGALRVGVRHSFAGAVLRHYCVVCARSMARRC